MIKINFKDNVKFGINEFAGSLGDFGMILPLFVSIISIANFSVISVFVVYGSFLIVSGVYYGAPVVIQPLKAVAVLILSLKLDKEIVLGAGLSIGLVMFFFTITGFLNKLSSLVPKVVIRGVQFGIGLTLCNVAFKDYISVGSNAADWSLLAISFLMALLFVRSKRVPVSFLIVGIGIVYSIIFKNDLHFLSLSQGVNHEFRFEIPSLTNLVSGFILLGIPQIPLSIGNSIFASNLLLNDYFPDKKITVNRIGLTFSLFNILGSLFGAIPMSHASNGVAGHYTFGSRSGGSVVIFGTLFLIFGVFFSSHLKDVLNFIPLQTIGVLLFIESFVLIRLIVDTSHQFSNFSIVLIVGLISFGIPYGFLIGLVLGVFLYKYKSKFSFLN